MIHVAYVGLYFIPSLLGNAMSWPRVFAYGTTYVLSTARGRSLCFPTCPHATGFRRRNPAFFDFSSSTAHVIIAYYCSGDFDICSTAHKRFSICISGVLLRRRRRGIRALRLWSARRVRPVGCAVSMRALRLPECGTYCAWQQLLLSYLAKISLLYWLHAHL